MTNLRNQKTKTNDCIIGKRMTKFRTIMFLIVICVLISGNISAQENDKLQISELNSGSNNFRQSINMCPGGIIFGIYSFNVEYMFAENHGIITRFDYEAVSESFSGDKIDADGFGIILNYRYHFSEALESYFLGSYARYRVYRGTGYTGTEKFDLTMPELSFGINAGKRWVWNSGFNITLAFGYGIANSSKETEPDNPSYKRTLSKFEDEYDFLGPFLGEFSLGYAF